MVGGATALLFTLKMEAYNVNMVYMLLTLFATVWFGLTAGVITADLYVKTGPALAAVKSKSKKAKKVVAAKNKRVLASQRNKDATSHRGADSYTNNATQRMN